MFGIATFGILLTLAVWAFVRSCAAHVDTPDLASQAGTIIGLALAFSTALIRGNLHAYFWWQRLKLRFDMRHVCRLSLTARLDGAFADDLVIAEISSYLTSRDIWTKPAKLQYVKKTEAQLYVPEGLYLTMALEPKAFSIDGKSHLQLSSGVMELPVGYAARKLEHEILPLLSSIRSKLAAENASFGLDLQFETRNPFFALYIAHLNPEQVNDFRVILSSERKHELGRQDRIEIRKEKVSITAGSSEGIAKLARDFILLSPDLRALGS